MNHIVGVDPGTEQLGLVLVKGNTRRFEVVKYYVPRSPRDVSWWEKTHDLKIMIHNWIEENTKDYRPFDLAIEEPFVPNFGRVGSFGLQNRFIGMLYTFMRYNYREDVGKILLIHPGTVKMQLTGKGTATKDDMVNAAKKFTRLPKDRKPREAAADAIGVAYAAWENSRQGIKGVQEFDL